MNARQELLNFICCLKCKNNLIKQNDFLVCEKCGQKYEIRQGVPILVDLNNLSPHFRKQIKYFDNESKNQREYKLREWQKSYIDRLEENFQFKNNQILIDVGAGSGYIAIEMAKKGLKIIACDLALSKLTKLKKIVQEHGLENNVLLVCCSAEDLPFKNGIADYLAANAILEHLPEEKKAIAEISRVCKAKSGLMITVPLRFKYVWPFFIPLNYFHDKAIGHLRRYDRETLSSKFGRFGYKVRKIYYTGHWQKTIVALFSMVLKTHQWDGQGEAWDERKINKKYGANNICAIFER